MLTRADVEYEMDEEVDNKCKDDTMGGFNRDTMGGFNALLLSPTVPATWNVLTEFH